MQWVLAILVILVVLGVVLYLGRDVKSDLSGAGLAVVATAVIDAAVT